MSKIKVFVDVELGQEVTIKPLAADLAQDIEIGDDKGVDSLSLSKTATATGGASSIDVDVDVDF